MSDTTKPDLSREVALRALADRIERADCAPMRIDPVAASVLRALLDAKEAAEELARKRSYRIIELAQQVDEARASVAASWEAGRDVAIAKMMDQTYVFNLPGYQQRTNAAIRSAVEEIRAIPNPYGSKEAAR